MNKVSQWIDKIITEGSAVIHKEASAWESLSYEAQKEYLKAHPKSKKRITAKPGQKGQSLSGLQGKLEKKKQNLEPDVKSLSSFKFGKSAIKEAKAIADDAKEKFDEWGGKFSDDDIDSFVDQALDAVEVPEEENDDFENLQSELRDLIKTKIQKSLKGMIKDTSVYDEAVKVFGGNDRKAKDQLNKKLNKLPPEKLRDALDTAYQNGNDDMFLTFSEKMSDVDFSNFLTQTFNENDSMFWNAAELVHEIDDQKALQNLADNAQNGIIREYAQQRLHK